MWYWVRSENKWCWCFVVWAGLYHIFLSLLTIMLGGAQVAVDEAAAELGKPVGQAVGTHAQVMAAERVQTQMQSTPWGSGPGHDSPVEVFKNVLSLSHTASFFNALWGSTPPVVTVLSALQD